MARTHPPITLHDLDIYFSERQGEARGGEYQHIGITYNINHGVQIIPPGPGPAIGLLMYGGSYLGSADFRLPEISYYRGK